MKNWILRLLGITPVASRSKFDLEMARHQGSIFEHEDFLRVKRELHCTHRKGGQVRDTTTVEGAGIEIGQGSSHQYAVVKHQMMNGDWWVLCLRCNRRWKPPLRSHFDNPTQYWIAVKEYEDAVAFPTNNVRSTSVQFAFKDGTIALRQALANS